MLSTKSDQLSSQTPPWLLELLSLEENLVEKSQIDVHGHKMQFNNGILRQLSTFSESQQQTEETFGFKWRKRDTFESEASLTRMREWLINRYGNIYQYEWLNSSQNKPIVLDAGCGASMSALELFKPILSDIKYLGIDVSASIDVARDRFSERGLDAGFIQADITQLPLPPQSVDVIFSEGVLHHTDSTKNAFMALAPLLKINGRFMFYVYRKKGPVREFTDDYIREKLKDISQQDAWDALIPLTRLGKKLGELNIEIDIPENVDLLDIPAGKINLQRLFYWHVFKAFYHETLDLDEMNHINFDWFTPQNAHRQTEEQIRTWCREAGFEIEREIIEDAGITVIAKKIKG